MAGRRALTDSLGHFEFAQFAGTGTGVVTISVTKPGFTQFIDPGEAASFQGLSTFASSVGLTLYPDAIMSGTVMGSNGLPLSKVGVTAFRETLNELQDRAVPVGFTQTDSHGSFRFEEPPGRYRVHVGYSPRATEIGEAMLPVDSPEQTEGGAPGTFTLGPGEERRVDLRPRTSMAYPVSFRADGEMPGGGVQVVVGTGEGSSYMVMAQPTRAQGEYRVELPAGSYQLRAIMMNREGEMEAQAKVTVADRAVDGLVMHFATIPAIPLELIVDPGAVAVNASQGSLGAALTAPRENQFSLRLQSVAAALDVGGRGDVVLSLRGSRPAQFVAPSGVYRLRGQSSGSWYVKGATYGTTNLLTDRLVVAQGSGGETIRVMVTNATGRVFGSLRTDGKPTAGVIYLISHEPSLTQVRTLRTANGSYDTSVPPGTYTIVGFSHSFGADLRDPGVLAKVVGVQTVEVTTGGSSSVDLTIQARPQR